MDAGTGVHHAATLLVSGAVSLASGGTVTLADAADSIGGSGTLENINNTVQGQGTIGGSGFVLSTDSAGSIVGTLGGLVVDGGTLGANDFGTFAATAGGTLELRGLIVVGQESGFIGGQFVNGGNGTVSATGAAALVRIGDAVLRNGLLTSSAGGQIHVIGSATLASSNPFAPGLFNGPFSMENRADLRIDSGHAVTLVKGIGNTGTIAIASGASLVAAGGNASLVGGGTVTLAGSASLVAATTADLLHNLNNTIIGAGQIGGGHAGIDNLGGTIVAAGGTLAIDLGAGNLLHNSGTLAATTGMLSVAGALDNQGVVFANGGGVVLGGAVTGSGTMKLAAASQITVLGSVDVAESVIFLSPGALLTVGTPAQMGGLISGLAVGDTIDLQGLLADSAVFSGDSLTLLNGGTTVGSLRFIGSYPSNGINVTPDDLGGSDLTVACFASGTRLLTAAGEVAVEALAPGDLVVTHSGRLRPARWIGHRRIDCRRHLRPHDVHPVRIAAHAFEPGMPHRDLLLSPDHSVHVDGVLIPVRYLVNGATIRQIPVAEVEYLHVELERHDVLLAEGLPAESYLDTGNRFAFANGGGPLHLHPDFALRVWAAEACAPLITTGSALAAVQTRLLDRAQTLGHALTDEPDLRLIADGRELTPTRCGPTFRCALPPGARQAHLLSRRFIPAQVFPGADDHRPLGVAIADPRLDGASMNLDAVTGWHAPEPSWRWTDGDAMLNLAGGRELEFTLMPSGARYWAPTHSSVAAETRG